VTKKQVNGFMAEYIPLCEKWHITVGGYDNGPFLSDSLPDESYVDKLMEYYSIEDD